MEEWLELFKNLSLNLDQIREAGFRTYVSSSGQWWWERRNGDKVERQFLPVWVRELLIKAEESGRKEIQQTVKTALGLKDA